MPSTPTPRPLPADVEQLAADLRRLSRLDPIARAIRARALVDVAKAVLSATADDAVAAAVAETGPAQVARDLGVTPPAVTKALVRHRARGAAGS
jgi:hypothetical protein